MNLKWLVSEAQPKNALVDPPLPEGVLFW
jgi:hypothetical protein